jgi:hypothetical protein
MWRTGRRPSLDRSPVTAQCLLIASGCARPRGFQTISPFSSPDAATALAGHSYLSVEWRYLRKQEAILVAPFASAFVSGDRPFLFKVSILAPAFRSRRAALKPTRSTTLSDITHRCSGVSPNSDLSFTSDPALMSTETTSSLPLTAARWSAVHPSVPRAASEDPASINSWAMRARLLEAAL